MSKMDHKRREDLEISGLESLRVEIINSRRRIHFGLFHRAPNSNANYKPCFLFFSC